MKTIISLMPEINDFIGGRGTLEIGYPWLTHGSIMALERLLELNKDFVILECGSGGSTIFFAKRCKSVLSLETNPVWAKKVKDKLEQEKIENVNLIILKGNQEVLDFLSNQPDGFFDLVLVDSDPTSTSRLDLSNAVVSKVKLKGWMLVDNWDAWGKDFDYSNPRWEIYTFDSFPTDFFAGKGTRLLKKVGQ